jgi:hypothetical protein
VGRVGYAGSAGGRVGAFVDRYERAIVRSVSSVMNVSKVLKARRGYVSRMKVM